MLLGFSVLLSLGTGVKHPVGAIWAKCLWKLLAILRTPFNARGKKSSSSYWVNFCQGAGRTDEH